MASSHRRGARSGGLTAKPEASPEERRAQTINLLRAFLIEKGLKVNETVTALSGNSVIVRYVKFPRLTKAELAATLANEAEPFIPFDINEVQLGFHILDDSIPNVRIKRHSDDSRLGEHQFIELLSILDLPAKSFLRRHPEGKESRLRSDRTPNARPDARSADRTARTPPSRATKATKYWTP